MAAATSSLPVPDFAAEEDAGVGGGHLVDAQVDVAHGVRVADEVFRPETLLQVAAEPQVLGLEGLLAGGFHPPRVHVEGDHGGDDLQQPRLLAQDFRPLDGQIDGERADDLLLQDNRHAEEADVLGFFQRPLMDAIGEAGFLRDAGDQGRLPRLQDRAENPLAATIAQLAVPSGGEVAGDFHAQLVAVRRAEHDRAADHPQFPFQFLQDRREQLPLPPAAGQQAADRPQHGQFLGMAVRRDGITGAGFHHGR